MRKCSLLVWSPSWSRADTRGGPGSWARSAGATGIGRVATVGRTVRPTVRPVPRSSLVLILGLAFGGGCGSGGGTGALGSPGSGGAVAGTGGALATGGGPATGGTSGSGSGGMVGGGGDPGTCPLFTADDAWNTDVSGAAVDAGWTSKLQALVGAIKLHPDFGTAFGIPVNVVPATQAPLPITFDTYPRESDPGPYPMPSPAVARVEGTTDPTSCRGDCHLLAVQLGACMLYEGYACHAASDGWHCSNGARWDLRRKSYGQRPTGWTSADAAGLPIYPGLARVSEVRAGTITHALRFTVRCTSAAMVPPATHQAVPAGCAGNMNAPPMGLRIRLKAGFDISGFNATAQVFLRAFKAYGLILADNGSDLYFQSEMNPAWNDTELDDLKRVPASAFEAVAP